VYTFDGFRAVLRPRRNEAEEVFAINALPGNRFAVCVANERYDTPLHRNEIYAVIEDADAAADGDLRIINETGEEYLYPSAWFIPIHVPGTLRQSVLRETG
jgi:hypothetical protein